MTSPGKDPEPLPTHDFEEHPEITELLASVKSPTMPAEVAKRLDQQIAAESAVRRGAPRRHLRKLALAWGGAAAAVLVVVAGVSLAFNDRSGSADSVAAERSKASSSVEASPDRSSAKSSTQPSTQRSTQPSGHSSAQPEGQDLMSQEAPDGTAPSTVVRPEHLAEDAARIVSQPTTGQPTTGQPNALSRGRVAVDGNGGCAGTREPNGDRMVFNVSWRDEPAVLVVSTADPQVATVYSCDGTTLGTAPLK